MPTPRPPRSMLDRGVAVALVALAAAACGGGEDVARDRFSSDLRARTTVPEEVADCLTDSIYDEFDQSEVNRIYRAASEDELTDETRQALDGFNRTCFEAEIARQEATATDDAPTDASSSTTADSGSTTTLG